MSLSEKILYHGSCAEAVTPTFGLGDEAVPLSFLKVAYRGLHALDLPLAVAKVAG